MAEKLHTKLNMLETNFIYFRYVKCLTCDNKANEHRILGPQHKGQMNSIYNYFTKLKLIPCGACDCKSN